MPLKKIEQNEGNAWALWKIEETEQVLAGLLAGTEQVSETITNQQKRTEWLAGRVTVKVLMEHLGHTFKGIVKDSFGKPFPAESSWQLSLSHSFPYVAAYLHHYAPVGIDLEQPKPKLLKVARRVFDAEEQQDAGEDLYKLSLYWCAKEAMLKIHGKKDLTFAKNLKISPFPKGQSGNIIGRIIVNDNETIVPLYYEVHPDFTIVLNKP